MHLERILLTEICAQTLSTSCFVTKTESKTNEWITLEINLLGANVYVHESECRWRWVCKHFVCVSFCSRGCSLESGICLIKSNASSAAFKKCIPPSKWFHSFFALDSIFHQIYLKMQTKFIQDHIDTSVCNSMYTINSMKSTR